MTFRMWQVLVAGLVAALGAAALSMVYTTATARESERKWCGIVTTLDDGYRARPLTTPAGIEVARQIARLREEFGCPPRSA